MLVVGQERIAELFGVNPKTIVEWQEQGFPVAKRGGPHVASEYRTEDCIAWTVQREKDRARKNETSPQSRLWRLQGDKVQREFDQQSRALIVAAELEPAIQEWLTHHYRAIDRLMQESFPQVFEAGTDPTLVHQALKDLVRRIKDDAAGFEFGQSE